MASDDLDTPLGLNRTRKRRSFPVGPLVAAALGSCLAAFAGWVLFAYDPLGGEPMAVVKVDLKAVPSEPTNDARPAASSERTEAPADTAPAASVGAKTAAVGPTITIIDGSTGKRQDVQIPVGDAPKVAAIDQRLLEQTRHGNVPRVGLDGTRPAIAYARPAPPKGGTAKVAIVVAGLGVSATATADALKKLPSGVTFAFVPYGSEVERMVEQARAGSHEILLQVPMEPFDYPDNDPGPQTLLTSLASEQNVDRMHWAMSRFQGYVGIANFMGGRFTSTEQSIAPVLKEVAKRGLIYVDDGSSPRSLASQIAGANNLPFAKAGVVLDSVPSNVEIDRALARLEAQARETGSAVAVARALPLSIERIAQWVKQAEGRGLVLVPISALAVRAKPS